MLVRYAKVEDIKEVAKINVDGWQTAYREIIADEFLDSLDYETARRKTEERFGNGLLIVCENDIGEILGFCKCGERKDVKDEGFGEYDCELYAIYVRPDCKGQGVGKKLFDFATRELKENGNNKMILWCLEGNAPTIEFYKKMGGKQLGKKAHEIGNEPYNEVGFGYELQ